MNGLQINLQQFSELPRSEKDKVIFENLEFIRKQVKFWKLSQKIKYIWLTALTYMGILQLNKVLG